MPHHISDSVHHTGKSRHSNLQDDLPFIATSSTTFKLRYQCLRLTVVHLVQQTRTTRQGVVSYRQAYNFNFHSVCTEAYRAVHWPQLLFSLSLSLDLKANAPCAGESAVRFIHRHTYYVNEKSLEATMRRNHSNSRFFSAILG